MIFSITKSRWSSALAPVKVKNHEALGAACAVGYTQRINEQGFGVLKGSNHDPYMTWCLKNLGNMIL